MSRRAWGVCVLAVALIAAALVPAVLGPGRRIDGVAAPAPIAPPPAVGDCLTAPPEAAGSPLTARGLAIAAAPSAACSSAWGYGEIVSVTADARDFPTTGTSPQAPPDPDACRGAVRDYLGWTVEPWIPVVTDTVVLIGPDPVQAAAGQRWIACVLAPDVRGYPGSLRDRVPGPAADRSGWCKDSRSPAGWRVGCADPHDVEVFGSALIGIDELSGLTDSCARLVAERTGSSDPTAGGVLQVRAGPDDPNTVPPDVSASRQSVICTLRVTGDGMLTASLVGRGDGPLPWG